MGVDKLFVEPGSPWENGYTESFNRRPRGELLDGGLCLPIDEMRYVLERWRMDYNHHRPHSDLGYTTRAVVRTRIARPFQSRCIASGPHYRSRRLAQKPRVRPPSIVMLAPVR
jgi:transposase InsO family protein